MKQYCRYCVFCFEADDFRCSNHPKGEEPHWTEEQIKRQNHCKNFQLADDVITGREYIPRKPKPKPKEADGFEQLVLDLEWRAYD